MANQKTPKRTNDKEKRLTKEEYEDGIKRRGQTEGLRFAQHGGRIILPKDK
jgi:hypothetical protein